MASPGGRGPHGLGALPNIEPHLLLTVRRDGNEKVKACWRFGTPYRTHCLKLRIAPSSTPSPPPIRLAFVSLPTPSKGQTNGPIRAPWRPTSRCNSVGGPANRTLRRSSNPSLRSRPTIATTKAFSAFRPGWFSSVSNSLVGPYSSHQVAFTEPGLADLPSLQLLLRIPVRAGPEPSRFKSAPKI